MKKKGATVGNGEIIPYLLSGCFKELTTKQGNTYVRCSVCRSTLFKKGKYLDFFFQNGHKKDCKYKKIEDKQLEDFKTQPILKPEYSMYSCGFDLKVVDFAAVEEKLDLYEGLRGEAKIYEKFKFWDLEFYDKDINFNKAGNLNVQGYVKYNKFDGTIVIGKIN